MTINFPNNPTLGQQYIIPGTSRKWVCTQTGTTPIWDAISPQGSDYTYEWIRPSDWQSLPTITSSDDKFVGLMAVHNAPSGALVNKIALMVRTSPSADSGTYTVDWGDGTIDTVQSNVIAEHTYTYSTLSTTITSKGYKTAAVVVTPDSGTITTLDLQKVPTGYPIPAADPTGIDWLEMIMSLPNATTVYIGPYSSKVAFRYLEHVNIKTIATTDMYYFFAWSDSLKAVEIEDASSVTNMEEMFYSCYSLRSVSISGTQNVTNMYYMFDYCTSLESVYLSDTSSVTNMASMFYYCSNLQNAPFLDTSSVTDMSDMFDYCFSLKSVPQFNTQNVTSMYGMFYNCHSLESVPLFDTSSVTNMSSMFTGCEALKYVPLFNTSNVTSTSQMFYDCYSLESVPLFDLSSATSLSEMFYACVSLKSVPLFDLSSATATNYMFYYCVSLQTVPLFDMSSVIYADKMFSGCNSLMQMPSFNLNSATSATEFAKFCASLSWTDIINLTTSSDFSYGRLSTSALNNLYTNLGTVSGKTLNVMFNPGASTSNTSIATAKGWTVLT